MVYTKITRNGQITLPKKDREELGLREGTTLLVARSGDVLTVRKAKSSPREKGGSVLPEDFEDFLETYRGLSGPRL